MALLVWTPVFPLLMSSCLVACVFVSGPQGIVVLMVRELRTMKERAVLIAILERPGGLWECCKYTRWRYHDVCIGHREIRDRIVFFAFGTASKTQLPELWVVSSLSAVAR